MNWAFWLEKLARKTGLPMSGPDRTSGRTITFLFANLCVLFQPRPMPCRDSEETCPTTIGRVTAVLILMAAMPAHAWGPHPAITQAAIDSLGTNDALARILGGQTQRLTNYCWMADFKRLPFKEPDQDFYADDYLLFPQATVHFDHICPEVKQTYRPYFERALQALRMESPANAARWIGSLLHFVEDTGSPPHAAEIRGGVHSKMENWVDAHRIRLGDYRPQLLGANDAEALAGFLHRMDGLIEFSKPRGKSLVTPVLIGNQGSVKPVVLECALETSRVTADLLYTLGHLARTSASGSATLSGRVVSEAAPGFGRCPARIVFQGTNISTMTDVAGAFELRHLPAGTWMVTVFRPGSDSTNATVTLESGRTNMTEFRLPQAKANLVRNGNFSLKWVRPDAPDCWTKTPLGWEGEIIPLIDGQRYELTATFKPRSDGQVLVRWTRQLPHTLPQNTVLPKIDSSPLTPTNNVLTFTGSPTMALLQVSIRSSKRPEDVCEGIRLVAVKDEAEALKK